MKQLRLLSSFAIHSPRVPAKQLIPRSCCCVRNSYSLNLNDLLNGHDLIEKISLETVKQVHVESEKFDAHKSKQSAHARTSTGTSPRNVEVVVPVDTESIELESLTNGRDGTSVSKH